MVRHPASALAAACAALLVPGAFAQQLPAVTVESTREDLQGIAASASEGIVTSKQLQTRPLLRAGDIMESVPGLVATQHAGEGKANQYFLRGFNLDHGTDFATYVDGVLVNLPTHGHGQGYTDLYFLIPELVDTVQYRKGPYYAEEGDFATAGSARIRTFRRLAQPIAQLTVGAHAYRRALAAGSFAAGAGDLLLAAERTHDDGPWDVRQRLSKTNIALKYSVGTEADGFSAGATHYEASWLSTDQVPQRAIDSGLIGRFGSLDPTAGGMTRRSSVTGEWAGRIGRIETSASAYALRYAFGLFSNFTYATRGCDAAPLAAECNASTALDQFEQVDRRTAFGAALRQGADIGSARLSWGADLRRDDIGEVGLYDTQARVRLATVRSDAVRLDAAGLWTQVEMPFAQHWRATGGLRWDHRAIDVASSVAANSGSTSDSRMSPKLSLAYMPTNRLDIYANWGRGFHSNDARGAVIRVDPRDGLTPVDRADPLVPATGYEVGTRWKPSDRLVVTAAAWALKLDSELVFVGDAGTTEASRPSARRGLELTANWRPARAWEVDADLSLSRARFRDADPAGDRIPGALERVASVGATWAEGPWTLGARLRHFGSHPLIEDNSIRAPASTVVNLRGAYKVSPRAEVSLDVFNLFDRESSDIQYAYASRLPGEPPFVDGVTPNTVHLHPSLPRTLRLGLKIGF